MLKNTLFSTIVFQLVIANSNTTNDRIQTLQREKNELLKQINEAIEESVKSLQKSNETDALIGLKYMSDLKEHLKHVNDSADDNNHNNMEDPNLINRRSIRIRKKKTSSDPFDFESILKPGKMSEAKYKELVNNRIKMQKQINDWILQRERKKERLMKYKLQKKAVLSSGKFEKCPRFGYGGKRIRDKKDEQIVRCKEKITSSGDNEEYKRCVEETKLQENSTDDDVTDKDIIKYVKSERPKKEKYPCCRKCCKKSYLGCL